MLQHLMSQSRHRFLSRNDNNWTRYLLANNSMGSIARSRKVRKNGAFKLFLSNPTAKIYWIQQQCWSVNYFLFTSKYCTKYEMPIFVQHFCLIIVSVAVPLHSVNLTKFCRFQFSAAAMVLLFQWLFIYGKCVLMKQSNNNIRGLKRKKLIQDMAHYRFKVYCQDQIYFSNFAINTHFTIDQY